MTDLKRLTRIMKALSNETRLALYLEIAEKQQLDIEEEPSCKVRDIMQLFSLSAPTMSHHLKELANAGLVVTERRGKFLVARVDAETLEYLLRELTGAQAALGR